MTRMDKKQLGLYISILPDTHILSRLAGAAGGVDFLCGGTQHAESGFEVLEQLRQILFMDTLSGTQTFPAPTEAPKVETTPILKCRAYRTLVDGQVVRCKWEDGHYQYGPNGVSWHRGEKRNGSEHVWSNNARGATYTGSCPSIFTASGSTHRCDLTGTHRTHHSNTYSSWWTDDSAHARTRNPDGYYARVNVASPTNEEMGHDPVAQPSHYTDTVPGIECIQVTQHFPFNRGNAIKYIWRAGAKGNEIEDLKKAKQYIDFEIAKLENRSHR